MKKINIVLLSSLLSLFFLASCIKPVTDEGPKAPPSPNMSCMIDGVKWSAHASALTDHGTVTITGIQTSDSEMITLTINGLTESVYNLQPGRYSVAAYKPNTKTGTEAYLTGVDGLATGTIEVTSFDINKKTISGTFSFTGVKASDNSKKTVTTGVFTNIAFTGSLPPASSVFSAKIDGVDWLAGLAQVNTSSGTKLIIKASGSDSKVIHFSLPLDIGPGTYALTQNGSYYVSYFNGSLAYNPQSGTIHIISSTNTELSGEFEFKAENVANAADVVNITSGSFEILL